MANELKFFVFIDKTQLGLRDLLIQLTALPLLLAYTPIVSSRFRNSGNSLLIVVGDGVGGEVDGGGEGRQVNGSLPPPPRHLNPHTIKPAQNIPDLPILSFDMAGLV